jgi:hypothetical protein
VREEGGELDVLLAGVGAVKEPLQLIQEIIVLILQGLALGQAVLGVDQGGHEYYLLQFASWIILFI